MKWEHITITDLNNNKITGDEARKFVQSSNKTNLLVTSVPKGIVITENGTRHAQNDLVAKHLNEILRGKVLELSFVNLEKSKAKRYHVGRAVSNVVNLIQTRLIVEFIFKQDPRSTDRHYVKKPVGVTLEFAGSDLAKPLTKKVDAVDGIADCGILPVGEYTLTPDYARLDPCEFDWVLKPAKIVLNLAEIKTVTFEVEPLYQKVQLVAHCLLSIADFSFVRAGKDAERVVDANRNGKKMMAYASRPVGKFLTEANLSPNLPPDKATIAVSEDTGAGTLTMNAKPAPPEYWTIADLDPAEFNLDKIIPAVTKGNPRIYTYTFEPGFTQINVPRFENEKATITPGQFRKLTLKQKPPPPVFWDIADIAPATWNDKIIAIDVNTPISRNPDTYAIQFEQEFVNTPYVQKDLDGTWMGKYHGLKEDRDDMDARVKLVKATLEFAYKRAKTDPTILKVFMLPECFFQGRYGAYLVEDADHLLSQLLDFVGDVRWRDWIFVFGTVNLTFGSSVREMMNYSPVMRGGLAMVPRGGGGGFEDTHVRLIQKLTNSAELLDDIELLHHVGEETRTPSVNDFVQFQGTQNDEDVGKILLKAFFKQKKYKKRASENDPLEEEEVLPLAPDFGVNKGLRSEQWEQLKAEIQKSIEKWGLARTVRAIRVCNIKDAPGALADWGELNGYKNIGQANLQPEALVNPPMDEVLQRLIRAAWEKYFEKTAFDPKPQYPGKWKEAADPGPTRRAAILTNLLADLDSYALSVGVTMQFQKDKLKTAIEFLLAHEDEAMAIAEKKTDHAMVLQLILKGWDKYYEGKVKMAFSGTNWQDSDDPGPSRRADILLDLRDNLDSHAAAIGVTSPTQKSALLNKILSLIADDATAAAITDKPVSKLPDTFAVSIFPIWKRILDLYYLDNQISSENLTLETMNMNFRDYCFGSLRKVGPFEKLSAVENLAPCKRLLYGVEICADHGSGGGRIVKALTIKKTPPPIPETSPETPKQKDERIKRDKEIAAIELENASKAKMKLDLQFVPSAGFYPTVSSIAARTGGYCFNCDGWNKGTPEEVNRFEAWFYGPQYDNKNPVYPHTALARGGGKVKTLAKDFRMERLQLAGKIDKKLGDGILNKDGVGELHVYNEVDLPKN